VYPEPRRALTIIVDDLSDFNVTVASAVASGTSVYPDSSGEQRQALLGWN
jgi:hypothetical protein